MKAEWDNCINEDRNALVFADRNQSYGAYVIRKDYSRTVLMAFLISSLLIRRQSIRQRACLV